MRLLMGFRKPLVALESALRDSGCELVPWEPGTAVPEMAGIAGALVDFTEAARHLRSLYRLRRALDRGVPIFGLDRDAPWYKGVKRRRLRLLAWLKLLDVYASHSLQPGPAFAPHRLYLPNAARLDVYNLHGRTLAQLRRQEAYRYDVSFLGNVDAKRYPEHRERVRFLDAVAARLEENGVRLERFDSANMAAEAQVAVIQASRINLNVGAAADNSGERSWGLPERCYGIPACGAFLLSDARLHAADDFVPGSEWIDFANEDDCVAKILDSLAHFDRTRDVAEAAHAKVMSRHTYAHRATALLAALQEWRTFQEIR